MITIAVVVAALTLLVGVGAAACLRLLPTLRLQLAALALLAMVLPMAGVLITGVVMFHMGDDVEVLAVSCAGALSAVVGASLLARWIATPLERLRAVSAGLAAGDLAARASERGTAELSELGRAFNRMAESIERLFEARSQLVAWASHDLRTPLSSMRAMLEAIEVGLAEPGEYLPAIHDQTRVLSQLVDDLFELTRIDVGVLTLELRDVSLDGLVAACVRGLAADARAKGIRLEARCDRPLPDVRCAPEKVERILHNLLTNALRHTPADGSVAVVVSAGTRSVTVAVEDDGEGLTRETQQRLVERFWRADPARGPDGSGLGLAIAQGLVEAQGGRIWAENRPDGGTRVAFTLLPARSAATLTGPGAPRTERSPALHSRAGD
jgi:two-component system sensor histidine kinase BaeS